MAAHLMHARLLMAQSRWSEAAEALRKALSDAPAEAELLSLLALCEANAKRPEAAKAAAEAALAADPEDRDAQIARIIAMLSDRRWGEVETAARRLIARHPNDATAWHLLGVSLVRQGNHQAALDAVHAGLAVDPQHEGCLDLRGFALSSLGRRDEAAQHVFSALQRDPDNAEAHANVGYELLHRRDPAGALTHFSEALRLEPSNDFARTGLVLALKARSPVYRLMLGVGFLLMRFTPAMRWLIIVSGFTALLAARRISDAHPDLGPWLSPVIWVVLGLCYASMLANPLLELMLMTNPQARYAMSERTRRAALATGGVLLLIIAGSVAYLAHAGAIWLIAAFLLLVLAAELYETMDEENPRIRRVRWGFTATILALGGMGWWLMAGDSSTSLAVLKWWFYVWIAAQVVPAWMEHRGS